jgi:hypothetical protein
LTDICAAAIEFFLSTVPGVEAASIVEEARASRLASFMAARQRAGNFGFGR